MRRGDAAVPRDRDLRDKIRGSGSGGQQHGPARLYESCVESVAESGAVIFLCGSEHNQVGKSRGKSHLVGEISLDLAKRRSDISTALGVFGDGRTAVARSSFQKNTCLARCFARGTFGYVHDFLNDRG